MGSVRSRFPARCPAHARVRPPKIPPNSFAEKNLRVNLSYLYENEEFGGGGGGEGVYRPQFPIWQQPDVSPQATRHWPWLPVLPLPVTLLSQEPICVNL